MPQFLLKRFQILKGFSFADIKGFLTDVKPALLSALDTEYEKNPYEVCQDAVQDDYISIGFFNR